MRSFFFVILLFCFFIIPDEAFARRKTYHKRGTDFTKSKRYASLVVNAETGDVISKVNASKQLYPASLTKVMTLYLTFEAIENGKLHMHQLLPVSLKASRMPKTNLNLRRGQKITVRDAILGLIIRSANDASVVLAEAISGSEAKFGLEMTKTAKQLGMESTTFKNSSGLPHPNQITTAYDMARLAIAIKRDYPRFYPLFSKKSFKFRNSIITHHNKVLDTYPWADGLKTGFTNASGYNLITSTTNKKGKLIGVVMGGSSSNARDRHMIALLNQSYSKLDGIAVANNSKSPFSFMQNASLSSNTEKYSSVSVFDAVDKNSANGLNADLVTSSPFKLVDAANHNTSSNKIVKKKKKILKSLEKSKRKIKTKATSNQLVAKEGKKKKNNSA